MSVFDRTTSLPVTMGLAEVNARLFHVAAEVNKTGTPVTVLHNNKPWIVIAPVEREAAGLAIDFMDEYPEVFEELIK